MCVSFAWGEPSERLRILDSGCLPGGEESRGWEGVHKLFVDDIWSVTYPTKSQFSGHSRPHHKGPKQIGLGRTDLEPPKCLRDPTEKCFTRRFRCHYRDRGPCVLTVLRRAVVGTLGPKRSVGRGGSHRVLFVYSGDT